MATGSVGFDLFSAITAASQGVTRILGRDPGAAVLFWGVPPEIEVVHREGLPEDVCRALTTAGGREIAEAARRSGHPILVRREALSDGSRELRTAMRVASVPALGIFPLFAESGVAGCLAVSVDRASFEGVGEDEWRAACHALEGLQLLAATAALRVAMKRCAGDEAGGCDGVLVVDRWERVIFAHGLFRSVPGWDDETPFGRALNNLPGGALVSAVRPADSGVLEWEDHTFPPDASEPIPVSLGAVPFGLDDGGAEGGRIVFQRDRRPAQERDYADATAHLLALAMRVAHASDDLSRALPARVPARAGAAERLYIQRSREEIEEADGLVRAVLDGASESMPASSFTLNEVVNEVLARYREEMEAERVRVFSFLRPELPELPADRLEVLRAIRLLVQSARGSLRPGGGSLTVRTWEEGGWVYCVVSDDGVGMPRNPGGRFFEPLFDMGDASGADELDVVRGIAESFGGRFHVESRPQVWTRYTLMFPAVLPEVRKEEPSVPAAVAVQSRGDGGLDVLVVDDNAALRSVVRRFLERRGHRVTEAVDGDDALKQVNGHEFDRVIVDVHMPGTDGPDFFTSLEGVAPHMQTRTIFMTGGFVAAEKERFIETSGRPSIRKPFDLEEMVEAVEGL
ncbi:MAG: response regulator [Gemmatimonadota bacterium]|nr:response regulator [Gemmatimonadota bacterium]MDH5758207.1 response regulator [Gemmatimonadota bacterium]